MLFVSASAGLTQTKEITRDEYYAPWRAAFLKARGLSRRHVSKTEVYKDEKVSETDEWLYENVVPDRIRYVHVETSGGKTRRTEEIDIAQSKYCKRDDNAWEQVKSPCIGGGAGGVPNTLSATYSVENIKLDNQDRKLYRQYITYKNTFSKNKENEGLSYYETKYWLNKEGLIVREEYEYGMVDTKKLDRATIDTYEYESNIKIEAPIKQ